MINTKAATPTTPVSEPRTSESRVDRDSHFNGLYRTKQDLRIEGIAEGEIECDGTLTVAEGARVKAKVTASAITIAGELEGEVVCQGIFQISPSGQVNATVSARRLIVHEGGLYNGVFQMITGNGETSVDIPSRATWLKSNSSLDGNDSFAADADAESSGSEDFKSSEWWNKMFGEEATSKDDSQA